MNCKNSYVFFCDSASKTNWCLKPGFRHMFVLTHDDFNWIMIDPDWRYLNVKILPYRKEFNLPMQLYKENKDYKCIHLQHLECTSKHLCVPWKWFSCVGVIKYALGLNAWAFTPWQLYKKLKRLTNSKYCTFHPTVISANELGE